MTIDRRNSHPIDENGFLAFSYGEADEESRPRYPSLNANIKEDGKDVVAIIGGGFVGLSAAIKLAEQAKAEGRDVRIVLLERARVGSGASGKSSGHVHASTQASPEEVIGQCGEELGNGILEAVAEGPLLLRDLIEIKEIECDLRPNYFVIGEDNSRTKIEGRNVYSISPYALVLGLARVAQSLGVEIYENAPVADMSEQNNGKWRLLTENGKTIEADYVVGAAGQQMHKIPVFAAIARTTYDILVTTVRFLEKNLLSKIMPENTEGSPFSTDETDVAYGTVTTNNYLTLGAYASAWSPDPRKIAAKLFQIFPILKKWYNSDTGKRLGYNVLVKDEPLNFTAALLPKVGTLGRLKNNFFATAFGGCGIALSHLLGANMAEIIWRRIAKQPAPEKPLAFDLLSQVEHMPVALDLSFLGKAGRAVCDAQRYVASMVVTKLVRHPELEERVWAAHNAVNRIFGRLRKGRSALQNKL